MNFPRSTGSYSRNARRPERAGSPSPRRTAGRSNQTTSPAVSPTSRKAGLRRIRFHDPRHSTANLLLEQGVDLVVIKESLGHAHIGVPPVTNPSAAPPESAAPSSSRP
ncbi:tyrosine-type recombinase/integrase [Streptomyces sp. AM 3-1-1]|nr:tyrosine-type recombinase/integrase [Streptomyces sp. AM 3-1-1]WEH31601.1 tyrosine-type recombinase/integrase [Streptomyces sp. AM 3-1-1]